jgi:hypothetical protein
MPNYRCPRCGGKDGYTKRTHELRADGLKRTTITSWAKVQKLKNVDLIFTACKSCGEEMEEEFTPDEVEENNQDMVDQTIKSRQSYTRILRIIGYVLISLSAWIFISLGNAVIAEDRTDFVLPMMFLTLAVVIPGVLLWRKNRKAVVSVWVVSSGTKTGDFRSLLSEYAEDENQLNIMVDCIETNTPFNASGLIGIEEAREYGERLQRLGAKVRIG